jgi:S1-C subfamily serine protease
MGVVGGGAAAAAVAGGALLWSASSGNAPGLLSGVPATVQTDAVPSGAVAAMRALVALQVDEAGRTVPVCGVAVAPGGLVATPADAITATDVRVRYLGATASEPARVVSIDRSSGVALLRVPADPPPVHFSDDSALTVGSHDMVVTLDACTDSSPAGTSTATVEGTGSGDSGGSGSGDSALRDTAAPMWSIDTVAAVGTAVPTGDARGLAGIVVEAPDAGNVPGALLLDPAGQVLGILDEPTAPSSTLDTGSAATDVFLTGSLVAGVTRQLEAHGTVHRGWLDVTVRDAPPSTTGSQVGAAVVSVVPGGATAGRLHVGDVIDTLSGEPVRSMAELRTRLYVLPPGTAVTLGVRRQGKQFSMTVTLGGTP